MSEFSPQFPRTVAGADWRTSLVHPEIEAIAKRADHLYRHYGLSEEHRVEMLMRYAYLVEADKAIDRLGKLMSGITLLNDPGIRPARPVGGGATGGEIRDVAVGFALRLADWVQRLEDVYGVTAWRKLDELVNRDEDGNPLRLPGDDI
jgi:hypothetical protein